MVSRQCHAVIMIIFKTLCHHNNYFLVEPECTETDIQLVNGQTSDDGHVQVCLRGHWGSVCDDRWDTIDATVVCRQLGHDGR